MRPDFWIFKDKNGTMRSIRRSMVEQLEDQGESTLLIFASDHVLEVPYTFDETLGFIGDYERFSDRKFPIVATHLTSDLTEN